MLKTTKSYAKRLKVTRNGKILARKPGQNHFNAKDSSKRGINKRRMKTIQVSNKIKSRFLSGL